ncbi:hypothetical protein EHO60_14865 [Leptospira fletcheri]|uniref:XRE family transcriptional regulator n=1 Tax=Leptospira fletcheri TaxID=2484981 RepID=A0A4R9G4I9_9LEPT|nr:hypothetical protein [Leptospira fletcheri]TGK06324.1 hypothetical protein EHO60_14865 [Leptospira fletcheri]
MKKVDYKRQNIAKRFSEAVEDFGKGQEGFGKEINRTKQSISLYCSGEREPPDLVLHVMELKLGYSAAYIKDEIGPLRLPSSKKIKIESRKHDEIWETIVNTHSERIVQDLLKLTPAQRESIHLVMKEFLRKP